MKENRNLSDVVKFRDIMALWKEDKKHYVKKSTYAAYSLLLSNHLEPYFGEFTDIEEEDVQEYVLYKLDEGLSRKYVKDMLVVLKMILKYASKYGYVPYRQLDVRFPPEKGKASVPVLDRSAQMAIMDYVHDNFSFYNLGIFMCLSSGLRIGEACALKWDDIDVDSGVIRVTKTLQRIYVVDEGRPHTEILLDTPKSLNSNREIPMIKELVKMVRPLKRIVNGRNYVLTNSSKPTEPRTYRNYYKRLMRKLDLPDMKFHGLRHSFATRCIEGKCDYKTLSVILGHSNINTTLNLYVHPGMDQKKRCVEQMFCNLYKGK